MVKIKGKKECFVVTPIGADGSEIRRHVDGLIKIAIKPALGDDYDVKPAHEYFDSTSITKQVYQKLYESDLVIANLTGLNPNVMYELAIRFCFGKPVILIAQQGTELPFDIDKQRTLFYKNDFMGLDELKSLLKKAKDTIKYDAQPDSPIHDALKQVEIFKQLNNEEQRNNGTIDEALSLVLKKLDKISDNQNINVASNSIFDNYEIISYISQKIAELNLEVISKNQISLVEKMNLMKKLNMIRDVVHDTEDYISQKDYRRFMTNLNNIEDNINALYEKVL